MSYTIPTPPMVQANVQVLENTVDRVGAQNTSNCIASERCSFLRYLFGVAAVNQKAAISARAAPLGYKAAAAPLLHNKNISADWPAGR